MEIFNEEPIDWIDLQNKVAYIFSKCRYIVETPKKLQTARGEVEVDVYAKNIDILIVCECKYWESNVPQNIVFSFRTVVEDIGANKGIIIAKKGFQSGAYKSVQNTNIELVIWEDFLIQYKDKYLKSNIKELLKIKSKLFRVADDKSEYLTYYKALDDNKRKEVDVYKNELMKIVLTLSPMCFMLQNEEDREIGWCIEYIDKIISDARETFGETFMTYYEFFEYINKQINIIVSKIETIYGISIL